MRHSTLFSALVFCVIAAAPQALSAEPTFVNGIVIAGDTPDATGDSGANSGRFGFFSDIYYDAVRKDWWALSDRGPGGGTLPYETRVQRIALNVHPVTGQISRLTVKETVKFTDPDGLLYPYSGSTALNGLNPYGLTGNAGLLSTSFDPEGLVVHPKTGHLFVADEYGPSLYEFDREGRLVRVFETPANLVPKVGLLVNYVATRDACSTTVLPPFCGGNGGRQDNRGYEGLAITPDGNRLYAVLQDPLVNDPGPNNGRNGRNVRIIAFDNNTDSATYGHAIGQYVYQLELQSEVLARLNGDGTPTDPRQGRNIGVSAITAINDTEFLVLERDNRGIGVDDPAGARKVGSKRIYKIRIDATTTDVSSMTLPAGDLPAGITPVAKSSVWIDLQLNTLLPNGKQAEKWEGMAIGPRLARGGYMMLFGNDNDYSVTQDAGTNVQSDIYVDFSGNFIKCPLDTKTECQQNGSGPSDVVVPENYSLIPGVLHAYRVTDADLAGYEVPGKK